MKTIHVIVNNNGNGLQGKFLAYLKLIKSTLNYRSIAEAYDYGFRHNFRDNE